MNKIVVCKAESGRYFLRIHFNAERAGVIRFETHDEFSKPEADIRAMLLSSRNGWGRDELPTHAKTEPYPSAAEKATEDPHDPE